MSLICHFSIKGQIRDSVPNFRLPYLKLVLTLTIATASNLGLDYDEKERFYMSTKGGSSLPTSV